MGWDDDDWPIVGDDGTPSAESPMPDAGRDECGSTGDVPAGTYRVENVDSGLVAAVQEASTSDGADVIQRTWYGGDEQRWQLVPVSDDGCVEVGPNDTRVCDVDGDGLYRDFNDDGEITTSDVAEFFDHLESDSVKNNVEYFDYTGDGSVSTSDVIDLFESLGA